MRRPARQINHDTDGMIIEQAGALCLRVPPKSEQQVLLVGSRRNERWGLPKGHIDPGESSHETAAREAYEEAGVRGEISETIAGSFVYSKESSPNRYRVIVHRLTVSSIDETYPEQGLRARQWFRVSDAADVVGHEGLRDLLRTLG
ncbi:NUDIX hydrolase [Rhizobium sp. GR12]|uniref:NUDIX hydrolase n=1 Tax=Rhizobium sp. GR12 TaxID=3053925 RepID=UPI002FBD4F9B